MHFAVTKIQPPRPRPGWIARPRLESRFAAAIGTHRLVLVSAPAGFGKTALLARQVHALDAGTALAWIAADSGDDLHRLLECLVAALEPYDLPWRLAPEAVAVQAADGSPALRRTAAAALLNTLDAADAARGLIVLDDGHRVDDADVWRFLDLLLERLSPRWTLAISTRHDPPLALARLRAAGELAEFRQTDLAFDRDEVQALAAADGVEPAAADRLLARTHGWAAGLRLALSAGGAAVASRAAAIDRAMFDYLATEVLDRLDAPLRRFLLRVSVLPELTASRAAAVSGDAAAAAQLERVERLGLFATALDAAEPTIQLHDLFRDALEHRLRRDHPDEWPRLLRIAAHTEPDPARRLALLLRAGDLDAAAETLLAHALDMLTAGALATVAHHIAQFPPQYAARSPALQQVLGVLSWARWDFHTMVPAMQRAEAGYAAAGLDERVPAAQAYHALALNGLGRSAEAGARLGTLRRAPLPAETRVVVLVACLWHALDLGSTHRVGALLDELMDQLEATDDLSLWYRGHPIPRINGLPGARRSMQRWAHGALARCGDQPLPLRALATLQLGFDAAWHGRLVDAQAALQRARDDARWLGDPPNVVGTEQLLSALLPTLRGERDAALAAAQRLLDGHLGGRGRWSLSANTFYAARIAAAFDDLPRLREYLRQLGMLAADERMPPSLQRLVAPLHGHLAWLEGRRDAAIGTWRAAIADERVIDRVGFGVEVRLRLAAALADAGDDAGAADAAAPALAAVDAHAGIVGVRFARPMVARLLDAGALDADARDRLAGWCGLVADDAPASAHGDGSGSADDLSTREREVLERIAAGDSNKAIARAFDLSPHTVKRHVANILDKLALNSRGQAAAWWQAQQRH